MSRDRIFFSELSGSQKNQRINRPVRELHPYRNRQKTIDEYVHSHLTSPNVKHAPADLVDSRRNERSNKPNNINEVMHQDEPLLVMEAQKYINEVSDEHENLKEFLAEWTCQFNIPDCVVNPLLNKLNKIGYTDLPLDNDMLQRTTGRVDIEEMSNETCIDDDLKQSVTDVLPENNELLLGETSLAKMLEADTVEDDGDQNEHVIANDAVGNNPIGQPPPPYCASQCGSLLEVMTKTLTQSHLMLKAVLAQERNHLPSEAGLVLPQPFDDVASLLKFDNQLKENEELQFEFTSRVMAFGGNDYKKSIRNFMAYLMTNRLSRLVSWAKTQHTTSLSDANVKFIPLIIEGIQQLPQYRTPYRVTNYDIMQVIKDWLRRPSEREKSAAKKRRANEELQP